MSDLDHHSLVHILAEMNSTLAAAECHGLASGLLCSAATQKAKARWFSELLDSTGLTGQAEHGNDALAAQAGNLKRLDELFQSTVEALNSADLSFQLILPSDTDDLAVRVEALASWCSGFCAGIGFAVNAERQLPEDTREILQDFSAISRAEPDNDDEPGSQEESFVELEEYVRMGTLLICEELQPAGNTSAKVH